MYIYSVTIHIQKEVEQEWLYFMQNKHIDDVLNTGYFYKAAMRKSIESPDENAMTYNIEYATESVEKYESYIQQSAPALQKDVADRFAGKFTAQRAFYEVIPESQTAEVK